jgi:hypothetical protein
MDTLLALYGMNVTLLSRSDSNVTLLSLGSRAIGAIRQMIKLFSGKPKCLDSEHFRP